MATEEPFPNDAKQLLLAAVDRLAAEMRVRIEKDTYGKDLDIDRCTYFYYLYRIDAEATILGNLVTDEINRSPSLWPVWALPLVLSYAADVANMALLVYCRALIDQSRSRPDDDEESLV